MRFTFLRSLLLLAFCVTCLAGLRGGETDNFRPIVLRQGDQISITFPGSPGLNTVQRIRTDGRISLSIVGEVEAAGLEPLKLQERLAELFASELVNPEVNVVLMSRSFFVYVNGAVMRAGRNEFEGPVDLLEAIMNAGFNDDTANLKAVQVIRVENGKYRIYTENLQLILDGKQRDPFVLRQADMILVPRRWL